jgi:hypothetical protein
MISTLVITSPSADERSALVGSGESTTRSEPAITSSSADERSALVGSGESDGP